MFQTPWTWSGAGRSPTCRAHRSARLQVPPRRASSTSVESVRARGRAAHAGHDQALDAPTRLCGRRGGRHEPGGNQSLSWRPLEHSRTALSLSSWLSSTCTTRGNIVARSPPCLSRSLGFRTGHERLLGLFVFECRVFHDQYLRGISSSVLETATVLVDDARIRGYATGPGGPTAGVVGAVKNCLGPRAGVKAHINLTSVVLGRRACGRRVRLFG